LTARLTTGTVLRPARRRSSCVRGPTRRAPRGRSSRRRRANRC
jgi:hypothetical protein